MAVNGATQLFSIASMSCFYILCTPWPVACLKAESVCTSAVCLRVCVHVCVRVCASGTAWLPCSPFPTWCVKVLISPRSVW